MQCFVSMEEITKARLPANIRKAVTRAMLKILDAYEERYDPTADGCVVLVERSSTDNHARQLFGHSWADAPLEGVSYDRETNTFLAVVLLNNQLAHSIIVPNLPWLSPDLRANLMQNLSGEGPL